jgi:YegS/Rv2252/BmrU family lipid kinase
MIAVIINPIAGGTGPDTARIRAELAASALDAARKVGEVFVTERKGHARELAAAAVARGACRIVAWGGDGTVNEVGGVLAFGPTPLGIVPGGSGNGLATDLELSRRPRHALADALDGSPRAIDAGELGGRLFFATAGIGFDAHVAASFDRDVGGRRGFLTYLRIAIRELRRYQSSTYRVHVGGQIQQRRALMMTLANASQFGNGARIAPGAKLDDGALDLVVFEEVSRFRTVCAVPRLLTGRVGSVRGWSSVQIERAAVECERPMAFHVDGEPVQGGTRLEARVHSGALRICGRFS